MSRIQAFRTPMKTKKAFTLVELLTVIAIIIVLMVAGISFMNLNQQEAKNQAVKNRMDVLEQQLKAYKLKHGTYPFSIEVTNSNP